MRKRLTTYEAAVEYINTVGFLPLSRNALGFLSLEEITPAGSWHTGLDTDPWIWKDRVAAEKKAAYSKIIGKRPSFISLSWYPYFLAAYRPGKTPFERYNDGTLSGMAKKLFDLISSSGPLQTHTLKRLLSVDKKSGSRFESGLTELQWTMDITTCGAYRRISGRGEEYGWLITEYTTVEKWAAPELMERASRIDRAEALDKIVSSVRSALPGSKQENILKFLGLRTK